MEVPDIPLEGSATTSAERRRRAGGGAAEADRSGAGVPRERNGERRRADDDASGRLGGARRRARRHPPVDRGRAAVGEQPPLHVPARPSRATISRSTSRSRPRAIDCPQVERIDASVEMPGAPALEVSVRRDEEAPATFRARLTLPPSERPIDATLVLKESGPGALVRPQRIPMLVPPRTAALGTPRRRVVQLRTERTAAAGHREDGKRQLRCGRAHDGRSPDRRGRAYRSLAVRGGARLPRLSRGDPRAAGGSMTHRVLDVRAEDLRAATDGAAASCARAVRGRVRVRSRSDRRAMVRIVRRARAGSHPARAARMAAARRTGRALPHGRAHRSRAVGGVPIGPAAVVGRRGPRPARARRPRRRGVADPRSPARPRRAAPHGSRPRSGYRRPRSCWITFGRGSSPRQRTNCRRRVSRRQLVWMIVATTRVAPPSARAARPGAPGRAARARAPPALCARGARRVGAAGRLLVALDCVARRAALRAAIDAAARVALAAERRRSPCRGFDATTRRSGRSVARMDGTRGACRGVRRLVSPTVSRHKTGEWRVFDSTRVLEIVNAHYRTLQDLQRVHRDLDRRFAGLEDATLALILSAASGEPLLLIGPPGTAKSMLIKTFCELVGVDREGSASRYFEYLLTPFTEPGELFGFYDPSKLTKEGTLERIHADSMMQSAHVVFLDEVFKGSSAILNALLSFMNERAFYDRGRRHSVPLQCLFAATNELPDSDELQAIWDRFTLRCRVDNVAADRGRIAGHADEGLAAHLRCRLDEAPEARSRGSRLPPLTCWRSCRRCARRFETPRDSSIPSPTPSASSLNLSSSRALTACRGLEPPHGQVHLRDARPSGVRLRARRRRKRVGDRAPARGASAPAEVLPRRREPRRRGAPALRRHRRLARAIARRSHDRRPPGSSVGLEARGRALRRTGEPERSVDRSGSSRPCDAVVPAGRARRHHAEARSRAGAALRAEGLRGARRLADALSPAAGAAAAYRAIGPRRRQCSRLHRAEPRQADRARGVRRARLHLSALPGRDRRAPSPPTSTRRTAASLERIASRIAEQLASGPLFAAEHGNVVAALSEPSPYGRSRALVPEIDRDSLALLLGLGTEVDFPERASRSTPAPSFVPKRRPAPEGHGGRVEGLRQGRGEGQLASMVLSEFLNHPLVLVDRLLNSGYLVHERRPRRAKLRDALVVGLMPYEVRATPQGAFAKACWVDCMTRLARRLSAARLQDSEFRWIEGDAGGRARRSSFPLGQVPADMAARRHETFRDAFMTLSRWVPDYFETRAGFRPLRADTLASADEWTLAAWSAHVDRDAGSRQADGIGRRLLVRARHGVSPAYRRRARRGGRRRETARKTSRESRPRLPAPAPRERHLRAGQSRSRRPWHFGSDSDPYRALTPAPSDDGAALARALQSSWLDRLTKDIWHG